MSVYCMVNFLNSKQPLIGHASCSSVVNPQFEKFRKNEVYKKFML